MYMNEVECIVSRLGLTLRHETNEDPLSEDDIYQLVRIDKDGTLIDLNVHFQVYPLTTMRYVEAINRVVERRLEEENRYEMIWTVVFHHHFGEDITREVIEDYISKAIPEIDAKKNYEIDLKAMAERRRAEREKT